MPEADNWVLVAALLAVPVLIFAAIESMRRFHLRKSRIISTRSKMANRRR